MGCVGFGVLGHVSPKMEIIMEKSMQHEMIRHARLLGSYVVCDGDSAGVEQGSLLGICLSGPTWFMTKSHATLEVRQFCPVCCRMRMSDRRASTVGTEYTVVRNSQHGGHETMQCHFRSTSTVP